MRISKLMTDPVKELEGTWVDVGEGLGLLLARFPNDKYVALMQKLTEPHLIMIRRDTEGSAKLLRDLSKEAISKTVLLGWRNLEDDAGKQIEYSQKKAQELLVEIKDFYHLVTETAGNISLFRAEDKAEAVGN